MELLEFKHENDPARNRELFGLLGEYAASSSIREKLGGVISSEPGAPLVHHDGGRESKAGNGLRIDPLGEGGANILHLYALEEGADVPVLERCLERARENGATHLTTTDFWTRKELYLRYGFAPSEKSDVSCALKRNLSVEIDGLLAELENALKTEKGNLDRRVAVYNRIVALAAAYLDIPHPVACPQLVPVDDVRGNDYNPNKVAPPEMRLLKLSIRKDGFTMPVVVAQDGKGMSWWTVFTGGR